MIVEVGGVGTAVLQASVSSLMKFQLEECDGMVLRAAFLRAFVTCAAAVRVS